MCLQSITKMAIYLIVLLQFKLSLISQQQFNNATALLATAASKLMP